MPIFEFKCSDCGTHFEKLIRNSRSKKDCPNCGSENTEKQLSSFAVSGTGGHGGGCSCGSCSGHSCSSCSGGCH